ncbi:MAG: tripartite tricarboxylate transporter permease [Alkalispirochaeta sp.]
MDMLLLILNSLTEYWLLIIIGVTVGILIGAIPGFSSTNVNIILLPLTLGMETGPALAFMATVYAGSHMGGAVPAILFNVPGTGSAAATCFDGYPMTQQGDSQRALSISFASSSISGLVTSIATIIALRYVGRLVYYFGTIESFVVILFGLILIAQIAGKDPTKGLLAGLLGLLFGAVGYDHVYSVPRATFGILELFDGVERVPAIIGLFAISEALTMIEHEHIIDASRVKTVMMEKSWRGTIQGFRDTIKNFFTVMRSAFTGFFIGIVPGAGATIGSFVSYQQTMSAYRDREEFGNGNPKGVIASEAGNNGVTGGSLIPLFTLGIPGGGTSAVMLIVLLAHGVPIGPRLFRTAPELAYGVVAAMIIGYVVMLFVGFPLSRVFSRITVVPTRVLAPMIITFTLVGAYVARGYVMDMWVALFFGVLAFIMKKTGYQTHAILLGVILGPLAEQYFTRAVLLGDGDMGIFFSRPLGNVLWVLVIVSLAYPYVMRAIGTRKAAA